MAFQTHQFPYGDDNYGLLLHCTESNLTACVDAGDAAATEAALAETGWQLSHIFISRGHVKSALIIEIGKELIAAPVFATKHLTVV